MRNLKRFATVGAVSVASLVVAGTAFASGPTYAWQYGSRTVDTCVNHTSGGTAVGGAVHGQFVANSDGGGACSVSYLEVVYVNSGGTEVAKYAQSNWGSGDESCGAECEQIILPTSAYQKILEVIGSSTSGRTGNNTGGSYLYY